MIKFSNFKTKSLKKYLLVGILFFLILAIYNFRFEIIYNTSVAFGYDKEKSRRYSFMFSEKPYQILSKKFIQFFKPLKTGKEEFDIALELKKNFVNYDSSQLDFENGNYYLNIFKSNREKKIYQNQKLEYVNDWKDNKPLKIWNISTSDKISNKEYSNKDSFLNIQATPKICGGKLIYARPDGVVGAVDFRTGKKFWSRQYGDIAAKSMRGFFCEYEKSLDTYIILLPTGAGVYCLNSSDGSIISSRCGGNRMGVFESRTSPKLFENIVYIATVHPSGIEAYNFLTGKLIWRTDFEIGNFFLGGGSNPWSNFIIDYKKKLIFVNTGSPSRYSTLSVLEKYKFSGSLLAIDLKNGNIVWQFQEHARDTWNHDFVGQPILSPTKINGKDVVITLSKSGSVYFIDKNNGLPVFPIDEKTVNLGKFKYHYKKSTFPKSLMDNDYYNYLGKNCKNCNLNTTVFGQTPPILKLKRVFDGNHGGPQWPGASIDVQNNYLIFPSNHNQIVESFFDYIPQPLSSLPQNELVQKCTSCHSNKGGVNFKDNMIIPSLFLTTKIYNSSSLKNYLKNNNFHTKLNFTEKELIDAFEVLNKYDTKLINKNLYKSYKMQHNSDLNKQKDIYSNRLSSGKITAISLNSGKIIWQIPAGTHKLNNGEIIIGSRSAGGITNGENNEGISFFTGSFDKKIYAIRNKDGKYLWSDELPSSGSAQPLVYNTSSERWIIVVAGRDAPNDSSENILAFKQKLN